MDLIKTKKNNALRPSKVITRGGSVQNGPYPEYIIKIPDDFPGFEGLCLPLAIILVSKISLAFYEIEDCHLH